MRLLKRRRTAGTRRATHLTESFTDSKREIFPVVDPKTSLDRTALGTFYCNRSQSQRSEEHTSELQSRFDLVCRLLLEKKKNRAKKCRFDCRAEHKIK